MNNSIVKFNRVNCEIYYQACACRFYFKSHHSEDFNVKSLSISHFYDEFVKGLNDEDKKWFEILMLDTGEGLVSIRFDFKGYNTEKLNSLVSLLLTFWEDFTRDNLELLSESIFDGEYHLMNETELSVNYFAKKLTEDYSM
jgi:hypothetical protein